MLRKVCLVVLMAAAVSACGSKESDRAISGAGIGAGAGLVLGPPGVLLGGAIGAATGALTESDDVNLGRPVWKQ